MTQMSKLINVYGKISRFLVQKLTGETERSFKEKLMTRFKEG